MKYDDTPPPNPFVRSLKMLKNPRCLAACAMLMAVGLVLDQPFLTLRFGNGLKINFLFVPVALCGALYGPVMCAIVCVLGDILGVVLSGQMVLPQLIPVELVRGLFMGWMLFDHKMHPGRIVIAQGVNDLVINAVFNTFMLMWAGYISTANIWLGWAPRIIKNVVLLPVEAIILILVLRPIINALKKNRLMP